MHILAPYKRCADVLVLPCKHSQTGHTTCKFQTQPSTHLNEETFQLISPPRTSVSQVFVSGRRFNSLSVISCDNSWQAWC